MPRPLCCCWSRPLMPPPVPRRVFCPFWARISRWLTCRLSFDFFCNELFANTCIKIQAK